MLFTKESINRIYEIRSSIAKGLYRNIENKVIAYSNQSCFDKERETCKNNFYISDISNDKIDQLFKTYFVYDYITENKKVIANIYVKTIKLI